MKELSNIVEEETGQKIVTTKKQYQQYYNNSDLPKIKKHSNYKLTTAQESTMLSMTIVYGIMNEGLTVQ